MIAAASECHVLLALDTSRFARNELDAYRYGHEQHRPGIVVIYVTEWIVGSNAETAVTKGMHPRVPPRPTSLHRPPRPTFQR
jgi:hypothetical protein